MLAVALSLSAALAYGLADFVAGSAGKRAGAWSVAVVAQGAGGLAAVVLSVLQPGSPGVTDFGWGVAAGVCNGVGTAYLYRGLSSGRMGVVAPVSGVGAAAIPVVAGLMLGERPAVLVWCGIVLALPAIWLVSRRPTDPVGSDGSGGVVDGLLAGVGFGGLFVCLAQVPERAGFGPLALNQLVAGLAITLMATAYGGAWVPRERWALLGIVSGLLATTATLAYLLATQTGYLTVAAVVTSLYPAVTVVLAATVLREHVHRTQAGGLALCALAIALVAAG